VVEIFGKEIHNPVSNITKFSRIHDRL